MRIKSEADALGTGKMALIYGDTKVGKTTSSLASLPCPILFMQLEPRNQKPAIEEARKMRRIMGHGELEYDCAYYDGIEDMMKFLAMPSNFDKYKSVLVDSATYLMNVLLSFEIADEAFEARDKKKEIDKPLIAMNKLTMEGFGGLSALMIRIMNMFSRLSLERGKVIVFTALKSENVTYKGDLLSAAPNLKGKEFPNNFPAYMDLIGFVTQRREDGKIVYPPTVSFESVEGNFLAGWTGPSDAPKSGPLDWMKILQITNGQYNNG